MKRIDMHVKNECSSMYSRFNVFHRVLTWTPEHRQVGSIGCVQNAIFGMKPASQSKNASDAPYHPPNHTIFNAFEFASHKEKVKCHA